MVKPVTNSGPEGKGWDEKESVAPDPPSPAGYNPGKVHRGTAMEATLTSIGVGGLAGALAGLIWGGVGGRIAMRILLLTSDDRVRGLTSDDGFEIGVISVATIFLFIFTSILGTIAGLLYGFIRMLLGGPRWVVAIAVGITAAAGAGGGLIVHADGVDFRLLEPLWLAVGLFLLIPGAWGVTVVVLTERVLKSGAMHSTLPQQIDKRLWGATGNTVGWLVLAAITAMGLLDLARDVARLT